MAVHMTSFWRKCFLAAGMLLVLAAAPAGAQPPATVALPGFGIDRTEVSIGQFRAFAEAAGLVTEAEKAGGGFEWGSGWERRTGWTVYAPFGSRSESETEPAVHVSWAEAAAYCAWKEGRLPTADEWRTAAYRESREKGEDGFSAGTTYPYPVGDAPAGMNTREEDAWPRLAPVGTTRRGVNGLHDMGGNAWEWLADRRDGEALTAGGSWWYGAEETTASAMQWKPADFYAVYVGFRCVYDRQ
ncbi:MAG: formylglycine-generating enzyme family protein [Shinella sp.]|nr:formylglycine-generating enzyme family protein [Shinella sp.]